MNAALDTAAASRATFHPGVEKHHGFGDPESAKAQQPRPPWTAAFFYAHDLRVAHGFVYGGPCWGTSNGAPVPLPGLPT